MFALLGLLVSALAATAALRASELQVKRDAGYAEASVLDHLRLAANNAIFDQLVTLQQGGNLVKNGVVVVPGVEQGQLVWRPSVQDLTAMGYLPAGWSLQRSSLNGAPYAMSFMRTPIGCSAANCAMEGDVVLAGALRGGSQATDGAIIGPILSRLGADAGVSLPQQPDLITGFGSTWQSINPVEGHPAGVVAVRIGTAGSAFEAFVRIGDSRDPDLRGPLTVAGNTVFGSGSTTSLFKSAVDVQGAVTSSRAVSAVDGFHTATVDAFAAADPGSIVVKSGDFFVRNGAGQPLLQADAKGDVAALGDVQVGGAVQAQGLTLTTVVTEGDACTAGQVALLAAGGIATCRDSAFRASTRYAAFGSACDVAGQAATDPGSGGLLICRSGYFASVSGLLSSRVYMASFGVGDGTFIPITTALPQGCPATAGALASQAAIYLQPESDAQTAGNPVLNRNATWNGSGWTVSLTDGAGVSTTSAAIADIYCVYP